MTTGIRFTTSDASSTDTGIKVLTYGPAGAGKTLLCASAPNPLIISAESGLLSLTPANLDRISALSGLPYAKNIPVIEINTVEDLTQAYEWCKGHAAAHGIETINLDSLSEIAERVLNNAKRQVKDPRQAYGEMIEKMETVVRLFRDLPGFNIHMTAKMQPSKDELSGVIRYGPSMPGQRLGPALPYFFDEVFRLGVNKDQQGNNYRFLQTSLDLQYEAKDRSGMLAEMEVPHLGYLFAKIRGQL